MAGKGFYVEFLENSNEWEVRFNDGYRRWFDGDVSLEIVMERATEIYKRRNE